MRSTLKNKWFIIPTIDEEKHFIKYDNVDFFTIKSNYLMIDGSINNTSLNFLLIGDTHETISDSTFDGGWFRFEFENNEENGFLLINPDHIDEFTLSKNHLVLYFRQGKNQSRSKLLIEKQINITHIEFFLSSFYGIPEFKI